MRYDRSESNALQGLKDGQRLVRRDLPVRQPPKFPLVNVVVLILAVALICVTVKGAF